MICPTIKALVEWRIKNASLPGDKREVNWLVSMNAMIRLNAYPYQSKVLEQM